MLTILDKPSIRQAALPISLEQYHRLNAEGIVSEQTELLRGVIIGRMTKSPLHAYLVQLLVKDLAAAIGPGTYVRKEEPLTLADSEPEPDIAVVRGEPKDFRTEHPSTAELVIEVAVATLGVDRDKAEIYAAAGVAEYWIVVPDESAVEVFRDASASGYLTSVRHTDVETVLRPIRLPQAAIRLGGLFSP